MNKRFLISSLSATALSALLLVNIHGSKVQAASDGTNNESAGQEQKGADSEARAQSNVQNAQDEVNKAKVEVNNKEQNLAQVQEANQASIRAYDNQAKKVVDAQKVVTDKQAALTQAQVDAKQATPDKIAQTQRSLDTANVQYSRDHVALTNANTESNSKQTAYDEAKRATQTADTNVNNAKATLNAAKADRANKQAALDTAQANLNNAQESVDPNKIIIDSAFKTAINNAQNYLSEHEMEGTLSSSLQTEVKNAGASLLTRNHYQSSNSDKNEVVDIANISNSQLNNIREFYLNLLNGLRSQLGYAPLKYNRSAMKMSDEVAHIYENDNWNPETRGHDISALRQAYHNVGMNSYEEAMGFLQPGLVPDYNNNVQQDTSAYPLVSSDDPSKVTMDDIKNNLYGIVINMLFNDAASHWGHAMSLTHPGSKFMGLAISKYDNNLAFHMNPVDPSQIEDTSKFNQNDNLSLSDDHSTDLRNAVNAARTALNNAITAVASAQSNYESAVNDQHAKQSAEDQAKTALASAKKAVSDIQSALDVDQTKINNLTTELYNLRNPRSAVNAAQRALATAQSALQSEQNRLTALKSAKDIAQSKINAAQSALDQAKSILNTAQNKLFAAQSTLNNLKHPNVTFGDNGVVVTPNNQNVAFENNDVSNIVNNQNNSQITAVNLNAILHDGSITVYNQGGTVIGQIEGNQSVHLINKLTRADKVFYQLKNSDQWISSSDLDLKSKVTPEPSITPEAPKNIKKTRRSHTRNLEHKFRRIAQVTKKVVLVTQKGNKTKRTLRVGTNWKVFAKKKIRGKLYYRLGTQKQWALASHMRVLKHSKF
ncbi:SEC10/PgrA surface exclusion domain-containing protein [Lactobacillus ultunensis]|nr:SEC10/PgrA surface exclusion domain-containing protein [Lactobacillus ultunensis]QQP29054.1 SEC10/PgrA surface exclusion domain-containing protein [Lactobacillus ultunensis]